ncbi:putative protein YfkA [Pullulanibacillus camelliae]|uniref:Radical SAM core domain-containing protein n=1 Tax=Pullulanibacillus camelliae TaxID=1707096 RepID=A0A8J2VMQ1_9BACL|nr:radical SAM/CxCxxxxC motif protein YfkAB [Pullulanibacillus camelliae]GGE33113.1 putative protein YfkA [Pullulanibacillus camelliae]
MQALNNQTMTPKNDPWEAYLDVQQFGEMRLTNVEFTTTTLCNMRCEHCAVGYTLQKKDPDALPVEVMIQSLEKVPYLRALSITGGEPMLSLSSVKNYVVPILKYAHERGIRTQLNSNLTLDLKRYELILPYLDVLHISHNYGGVEDFTDIGFGASEKKPPYDVRAKFFERMVKNAKALSERGVFISAETMLNSRTLPHLEAIHDQVVAMGCQRHEIHPMYPSDFASHLVIASLDEIREGIHRLLDHRDERVWMLFGTLPFYPCSPKPEDLQLQSRLRQAKNVSVRNDPDGRSRLNVNIFDGEITVTDFGDVPSFGNVRDTKLTDAYAKWCETEIAKSIHCHCPAVQCLGPNLLVKDAYYQDVDFTERKAQVL